MQRIVGPIHVCCSAQPPDTQHPTQRGNTNWIGAYLNGSTQTKVGQMTVHMKVEEFRGKLVLAHRSNRLHVWNDVKKELTGASA